MKSTFNSETSSFSPGALGIVFLCSLMAFQASCRSSNASLQVLLWIAAYCVYGWGVHLVTKSDGSDVRGRFFSQLRLSMTATALYLIFKDQVNPSGLTLMMMSAVVTCYGVFWAVTWRERLSLLHFGIAVIPLFFINVHP